MDYSRRYFTVISGEASSFRKELVLQLQELFKRKGLALDCYTMQADVVELEQQVRTALAKGYQLFLAVGGDGTVSLLASYLRGSPHRLGIIPTGTANTVARLLGIPLAVDKAAEVAASSQKMRAVDGLEVGGRIYLQNVSAGASSLSLKGVGERQKSTFGVLSYIIGIFSNAPRIKRTTFNVRIDELVYMVKAVEIFVTNTGILGMPQLRIDEGASLDDGVVEVLMLQRLAPKEVGDTVLDMTMRKKKQGIQLVGKGSEVLIESIHPLPVQADGDIIGQTPVTVRVVPKAVNFIVP